MAKKSATLSALLPVGYILLGIVLMIWPSMSTDIFCLVVGVGALVFGIFYLVRYWQNCREGFTFRLELVLAVILAALGIFCLVTPRTLLSILPFFYVREFNTGATMCPVQNTSPCILRSS